MPRARPVYMVGTVLETALLPLVGPKSNKAAAHFITDLINKMWWEVDPIAVPTQGFSEETKKHKQLYDARLAAERREAIELHMGQWCDIIWNNKNSNFVPDAGWVVFNTRTLTRVGGAKHGVSPQAVHQFTKKVEAAGLVYRRRFRGRQEKNIFKRVSAQCYEYLPNIPYIINLLQETGRNYGMHSEDFNKSVHAVFSHFTTLAQKAIGENLVNTYNFYISDDPEENVYLIGLQTAYQKLRQKDNKDYKLSKAGKVKGKQHTLQNWQKVVECYRSCAEPGFDEFVRACNIGRLKSQTNLPQLYITSMTGPAAQAWVQEFMEDQREKGPAWGTDEDYRDSVDNMHREFRENYTDYVAAINRRFGKQEVAFERYIMEIDSPCPTIFRICYLLCRPDMKHVVHLLWEPFWIKNFKENDNRIMDHRYRKELERYFPGVTPWLEYLYSLPDESWVP